MDEYIVYLPYFWHNSYCLEKQQKMQRVFFIHDFSPNVFLVKRQFQTQLKEWEYYLQNASPTVNPIHYIPIQIDKPFSQEEKHVNLIFSNKKNCIQARHT